MFKKIMLAAAVATLASSCAVTSSSKKSFDVRTIEPQIEAVAVPLSAEIEVLRDMSGDPVRADKVIVFTPSEDFREGYISDQEIANLRIEAINRVAQEYKADLLVGVLTDAVYTRKEGKRKVEDLKIHVTGYPAVYKNFQSVKPSDEWITDYYLMKQKTTVVNKNLHETRNKEKK